MSPRPYSIKTRIKTQLLGCRFHRGIASVRDHIPLKQGLRHCLLALAKSLCLTVRDHIPLKQGLRPIAVSVIVERPELLRDHIPLKQGLRRLPCEPFIGLFALSETIFH